MNRSTSGASGLSLWSKRTPAAELKARFIRQASWERFRGRSKACSSARFRAMSDRPSFWLGSTNAMKCCPPPGLVADLAHEVRIVKDLELQKLMLGFGADKGIHGAALFIAQPSLVIARAPIAHLADFTGKKLRVFAADMQQEMIKSLGSSP